MVGPPAEEAEDLLVVVEGEHVHPDNPGRQQQQHEGRGGGGHDDAVSSQDGRGGEVQPPLEEMDEDGVAGQRGQVQPRRHGQPDVDVSSGVGGGGLAVRERGRRRRQAPVEAGDPPPPGCGEGEHEDVDDGGEGHHDQSGADLQRGQLQLLLQHGKDGVALLARDSKEDVHHLT